MFLEMFYKVLKKSPQSKKESKITIWPFLLHQSVIEPDYSVSHDFSYFWNAAADIDPFQES